MPQSKLRSAAKRRRLYPASTTFRPEKSLCHENTKLPADIDYSKVKGLSNEVVLKPTTAKPDSIGIASRISGITPPAAIYCCFLSEKARPY